MVKGLQSEVLRLARLLQEWKGEDTVALRLDASVSWASYCLISTCNSLTHMRGILNQLRGLLYRDFWLEGSEQAAPEGLNLPSHGLPRHLEDASWCPIDMGSVVLHLMSREARAFYELEQLWPVAEVLPLAAPRSE